MKRLLLLCALLLACSMVRAEGLNLSPETWGKSSPALFALGLISPIVAHEAGHQIAGGGDIRWHGTEWRCVRPCNAQRIAAAGFISEIAFTEFSNRWVENQAFNNGANLSTSLHLLSYAIRGTGDLDNFSHGRKNSLRAALMVASGYFILKVNF